MATLPSVDEDTALATAENIGEGDVTNRAQLCLVGERNGSDIDGFTLAPPTGSTRAGLDGDFGEDHVFDLALVAQLPDSRWLIRRRPWPSIKRLPGFCQLCLFVQRFDLAAVEEGLSGEIAALDLGDEFFLGLVVLVLDAGSAL